MKKLVFLAAAAALVLASCAKTEVTSVSEAQNHTIGFGTYTPRSLTKAGDTYVASGNLPDGSVMGVYGYSTGTANFAGTTEKPLFMDENFTVTFGATSFSTPTATNTLRYWPKTITNLLTFYGYYPYGNAAITSVPTSATEGLGSFGFTQDGDVTKMVDFMVSDVANDYYYTTETETNSNGIKATDPGYVPLKLRHMLAKVNFKFNKASDLGDEIVITVNEVSIAGVLSKGTLTPGYTAPTTLGNLGTTTFPELWGGTANTAYATAVDVPITSDALVLQKAPAADINSTNTKEQNFLFVPQTLTDDVLVTIKYTIKQGSAAAVNNVSTVALKPTGTSTNPASWGVNDSVVYTFTIGLTPIKFTATVQAWDDPDVTGQIAVN